jgi:hypothetical protein
MQQLNKYIISKAKEAGICEDGALALARAADIDEMLTIYRRGIDFCLSANFPIIEDLILLGGDTLSAHGIWIDQTMMVKGAEFTVLLGRCVGNLQYQGYTVSELYVKHQSTAKVTISGNAFLVIDCFDDTSLQLAAYGDSKVLVNIYGSAKVTSTRADNAIIKTVNKQKASY